MAQKFGIHHIAIRARDYEQAKKFYMTVFDAKLIGEWDHWKGFKACFLGLSDGTTIEMLGSGVDSLPENFQDVSGCWIHMAFEVEDVEAAVALAIENGATAKGEIKDNFDPYPLHVGAVWGPSGEIIEFLKKI